MEHYVRSSSDPSQDCVLTLLEMGTLAFPEYSNTANALMKRARLTKASNSDSQTTAEVEESSLRNSVAPKGVAAGEGGPNITMSVCSGV